MAETNATLEEKVKIDATTNAATNNDANNTQAGSVTDDVNMQAAMLLAAGDLNAVLAMDPDKVPDEILSKAVEQKAEITGMSQEEVVEQANLERINNLKDKQNNIDNPDKNIEVQVAAAAARLPTREEIKEQQTHAEQQNARNWNPQTSSDGAQRRDDKVAVAVSESLDGKDIGEKAATQPKNDMDDKIKAALAGMGGMLDGIKSSMVDAGAAPAAGMNSTKVAAAQPAPEQGGMVRGNA